jgi:hypothetical protein
MGRHRKLTMREQIEDQRLTIHDLQVTRDRLWHAIHENLSNYPNNEGSIRLRAVMNENAYCSCGRRASCWANGTGPKMCETCACS